ncbi:MAG: TolC family protein [Rhodospirillaceae bacterium]|nr:TolC family protein [Rhodospirillaceae bacterium]
MYSFMANMVIKGAAPRIGRKLAIGFLAAGFLSACAVTPEPIVEAERANRVVADLDIIRNGQFKPTQPISLYHAMARAVAFNLQHNVRQIERDIAQLELDQANKEGYPDVEGSAAYSRDDAVTSTGTDTNIRSGSFGGTWNVLDLGVSYARAQQSADRVLIAEERRRKALQDIIRNVRLAYWRSVGAQQLMTRMVAIEHEFSAALSESRRLEVNSIETKRRTVGFRRGLIDTVRQIIAARKDYGRAKFEFAQLINIQPGVRFTLQPPETMQGIPALPVAVEKLEAFALEQRPELRVEDYNERITEWESREALFGMFPGLDLDLTQNFSSDKGLVNTTWSSVGPTLGMNLFRLFSGPLRMQTAELRGEMARRQRLALSVGVLAQVHIAYHEFHEASYQFRLARQISRSDRELSKLAVLERDITQGNLLDTIDVAARQLRSEVQQHQAYVELRRSHGNILHALGLDVIGNDIPLNDVDRLRTAIRQTVSKWEYLTEEDDPNDDGTIEELVGQVLADVRRESVMPVKSKTSEQSNMMAAVDFGLADSDLKDVPDAAIPKTTMATAETDVDRKAAFDDQFAEVLTRLSKNDPNEEAPMDLVQPAAATLAELDLLGVFEPEPKQELGLDPNLSAEHLDLGAIEYSETPLISPRTTNSTAMELSLLDVAPPLSDAPLIAQPDWQDLPPEPAHKGSRETYDAQFGAFSEYPRAQALLAVLRDLQIPLAEAKGFRILKKRDSNRKQLFHVRLGSFLKKSAALQVCKGFKVHGKRCVAVRKIAATSDDFEFAPHIDAGEPITEAKPDPTPGAVSSDAIFMPEAPAASEQTVAEVSPDLENHQLENHNGQIAAQPLPPRPAEKRWLPRYDTQFGAFSEYSRAQALLDSLQQLRIPHGEYQDFRIVTKTSPGKQTQYHVTFGSYLGWSAAAKACNGFKAQGKGCIVVRHKRSEAAVVSNCHTADSCDLPDTISLYERRPLLTF